MYNCERISYVTANFSGLQGLRMLPYGIYFLGEAFLTALAMRSPDTVAFGLPLRFGLILLLVLFAWGIGAYYDKFGRVEAFSGNMGGCVYRWMMGMLCVGALCALIITSAGRGVIEHNRLAEPFNVMLILMGWLVALRFTTRSYAAADPVSVHLGIAVAGFAMFTLIGEVTAVPSYRARNAV